MVSSSPTHSNSPSLYIVFAQNERHSWVDVILKIENRTMKETEMNASMYMQENFILYTKSEHEAQKIGSMEDEMIIIQDSGTTLTKHQADTILKVKINTTFKQFSYLHCRTDFVSRHPMTLM